MKKRLLAALGLAAACFSLPAAAQLDSSAFYFGGSLGHSHFTDVCNGVPDCDDRDTAWGAFAGLQFSRYLGLEAGYRDMGAAHAGGASIKANALEAEVVANFPLRGRFGLIGRVGAYRGKLRGEGIEEKTTNVTYGWGVFYDTSPRFGFRGEWQRYAKMGGGDFGAETHVDVLSLGVVFRMQ